MSSEVKVPEDTSKHEIRDNVWRFHVLLLLFVIWWRLGQCVELLQRILDQVSK